MTTFQLGLTLAATVFTIISSVIVIYRTGIRPTLDAALREAEETTRWRVTVDQKFREIESRVARHEQHTDRACKMLEGLRVTLQEVLMRVVALETEHRMGRK